MTHKAESIMAAFVTAATGLTTTGANVERGRVHPLPEDILAALSIYQGSDTVIAEVYPMVTSELRVNVEAQVKSSAPDLETKLNQIRKELNIALSAHPPLGLSYCIDILETASRPVLDGSGERRTGTMEIDYTITYRRNRNDPSM
jgi:hypothetical protein